MCVCVSHKLHVHVHLQCSIEISTHLFLACVQIRALVQCGKLKNAYLIAIKSHHVEEVRNISQIAEKAGQLAVRDICEKWLLTNTGSRN